MSLKILKAAAEAGRIADELQAKDPNLTRTEAVAKAIHIQKGVI